MTPVHGFIPSDNPLPDYFAPKPPNTGAPWHIPLLEQGTLAPLIGLGGKLRAGKDAVGDYLEAKHGYTKLGMSDALNEALLAMNPLIPGDTYGWETEYVRYRDLHEAVGYVEAKRNPEVRRLLQALGTEVGREMIDPDVWVNIAVAKIQALRAQGIPVVITAVRFPNEVEMIRRLGGTTVWIERPERGTEGLTEGIEAHASETSVNDSMFDIRIWNNGTLEQLYGGVAEMLGRIEETKAKAIADFKNRLGGHELPERFGG